MSIGVVGISDVHLFHRRNLTIDIVNNLNKYFIPHLESGKVKLLLIAGDLFDRNISFNHDDKENVFDVYSMDTGYLTSWDRIQVTNKLGLKHVPVIHNCLLLNTTVEDTLLNADGQSVLADCRREGLVFKALYSDKTFKAVSNAWLLKYD